MNREQAKTQIKALRLDPEISNRFNCDLRQTTEQLITLIDEINEFNSQRFNQRANETQTEENEESPEEAVSRLAREIVEADESWGMTTETHQEAQEDEEETTQTSHPQPYIKPSIWYGITEGGAGENQNQGSHFIHPSAPRVPTA